MTENSNAETDRSSTNFYSPLNDNSNTIHNEPPQAKNADFDTIKKVNPKDEKDKNNSGGTVVNMPKQKKVRVRVSVDKVLDAQVEKIYAEKRAAKVQAKKLKQKATIAQAEKIYAKRKATEAQSTAEAITEVNNHLVERRNRQIERTQTYECNKAKLLKWIEEEDSDNPKNSCKEMISKIVQSIKDGNHAKQQEVAKNLWKFLYEKNNQNLEDTISAFHFVWLGSNDGLQDMQKFQDKLAIAPWALFNARTRLMDHVIHVMNQQITAYTGAWSWWLLDIIECITFGLNHASNRQYIQQIGGTTAYIFCNFSMRHGVNIFHQPFGFPNLQNFHVCNMPIFPDCVLKIIFGQTGIHDPATQIYMVRCQEHVVNIQIK